MVLRLSKKKEGFEIINKPCKKSIAFFITYENHINIYFLDTFLELMYACAFFLNNIKNCFNNNILKSSKMCLISL